MGRDISIEGTRRKRYRLFVPCLKVLKRHRNLIQIQGQGLSERLEVPLPFLMYRAQIRYEEDLRGLQAAMAQPIVQPSAQPLAVPSPGRQEDKPSTITPLSASYAGIRTSAASTPRQATPIGVKNRFTSHLRSPPALYTSHKSANGSTSASTVTLTHRPAAAMPTHLPTHLRPMSPPESTSSSEDEDDGERQGDQDDPEAIRRRLKDLERMMTSNVLGFARPKPTLKTPGPSSSVIRASPHNDTTSGGETTSTQSSIPSIPSPPESRLQSPRPVPQHTPQGSTQTGRGPQQSRSPPQSPLQQVVRNKMVGKSPLPKGSSHGSSASSFSDLSGT
jgi:hypothetical protein